MDLIEVSTSPPNRESDDKRCDENVSENAHETSHGNTPLQNYAPSLDNGELQDHDQEMNNQSDYEEDENDENNMPEISEEEMKKLNQQYDARMELIKLAED